MTVAVAGLVGVQVLVSPSERALVVAEQADTIVHQPLHNLRSHHDARGEHRDHGDAGSDHSPQQQRHQHQHQQQPHTPTRAGSSSQRDSHELPSPTTPHTDPGSSTGGATATGAAVLDPIADGDTEPPHSSSPGAVPDAPAVPAVPGVPGETPEPTPQQLGWRRGRSDTCFPSIGVVPIVPEEPPRGLTFRQLRRMLTGRCPVDVPEDTKRVLAEWKQRQHAMFKGKEPLKAVRWICSKNECGGHADRMKVLQHDVLSMGWFCCASTVQLMFSASSSSGHDFHVLGGCNVATSFYYSQPQAGQLGCCVRHS